MKFSSTLVAAALAISPVVATSVTYDTVYDQKSGSLSTVACSNGAHGLLTRGYKTFGDLPGFPNIGGASAVTGWNSPECGTCWELTFADGNGKNTTINIIAVDYAANGFNIALNAMNTLTGGHGVEYGVVNVASRKVSPSACGFKIGI